MKRTLYALLCLCLLLAAGRARGSLLAQEAGLNSSGGAFEVNPDSQGVLWVSDYEAGEVWGLNPESGAYDVYPVGGAPSDARHDGQHLWWADGKGDILGRVSTQDGAYTRWQAEGVQGFYGTALDAQGYFWAAGASQPNLYRLDAALAGLCIYSLPGGGKSSYIVHHAGFLWLGDYANARLLRLEASEGDLTWWTLPANSHPWAITVDEQGNAWYTDPALNRLARFEPGANRLTSYPLPLSGSLAMVAIQGSRAWFTEQLLGSVGALDPLLASSTIYTPTIGTVRIMPDCIEDIAYTTGDLPISSGSKTWSTVSYPTLVDASGWQIYKLPTDSSPWGITSAGSIWFVDYGRKVLGKITIDAQATACKLEDQDGDPATVEDQSAVPGWMLYLTVNGVRQTPGGVTGAAGCTTWIGLAAGEVYGVEEDSTPGWLPLGPTSHNFGVAGGGDQLSHTFVNFRLNQLFLPMVIR